MLSELFGNQNVARILYFLFVNKTCYGMQLKRLLDISLTPIQNALNRLEQNGIISSEIAGKTKIYQLSQSYPLKEELEALLNKAYHHLLPNEKKSFCFIRKPTLKVKEKNLSRHKLLEYFWERLKNTSKFSINVQAFWMKNFNANRSGTGSVKISKTDDHTLIFQERGVWDVDENFGDGFTSTYRWTYDKQRGLISLEHLRYGIDQSVFLFHLSPIGSTHLESVDSHLCKDDIYFAKVGFNNNEIHFSIRVIGPKKNEEIDYIYY
jgi:predicted transcriptional regulator